MALTDIKAKTSKPTEKQYKLTDANGMHLLVHTNGSNWSKDAVERQMSHQERNSVHS
ncbi:hypothetical protein GCM10011328_40730 [Hafnia psychrotolerans]|uniref:Integrase n=1 Tax=Hafnia psychrotolerans TaxID=1477018 RepID=A0ABQ1H6Q5_9GAMM|nr:hypothetical protein GCM10011328_40730 [Hafnia psychrotolerans]